MPLVKWRSADERFNCFMALETLMRRGIITIASAQMAMETILERPVMTHELGHPRELMKELLEKIDNGEACGNCGRIGEHPPCAATRGND